MKLECITEKGRFGAEAKIKNKVGVGEMKGWREKKRLVNQLKNDNTGKSNLKY